MSASAHLVNIRSPALYSRLSSRLIPFVLTGSPRSTRARMASHTLSRDHLFRRRMSSYENPARSMASFQLPKRHVARLSSLASSILSVAVSSGRPARVKRHEPDPSSRSMGPVPGRCAAGGGRGERSCFFRGLVGVFARWEERRKQGSAFIHTWVSYGICG